MESKAAQLRRRYPTKEKIDIAIKSAGSKTTLAQSLGMSRQNLNEHIHYLNKGSNSSTRKKNWGLKTVAETNAIIKEFFRGEQSQIKVYQLTEDYVPCSQGYEGLIYLRTDEPKMMLSPWARR